LIRIGTAGWTIPKQHAAEFPSKGTHLQRYAARFSGVEINSSFYRPHKPATYARWAASVPPDFRFAVKVPREITHKRKLADPIEPLDRFLSEAAALGDRLGPLLVQLPPSLGFDQAIADAFFGTLRARFDGLVVCEPRHPSWFTDRAEAVLLRFQIARAAADPAPVPRAAVPGGCPRLLYYRLHGSPRMYYSNYDSDYLATMAEALRGDAHEHWCIFDNTALGHATQNALALVQHVTSCRGGREDR
jgi:uncharacterized protein YecE (DUF72 family)